MKEGMLFQHEWKPSVDDAALRLLVEEEDRAAFEAVFSRAVAAYMPRAWVRPVDIEAAGDDFAMLSGEWFGGQRLGGLLSGATRAWVYAATAGESPAGPEDDELSVWWLQKLGEDAVHAAVDRLPVELPQVAGERISTISPGSLPDFPITEQRPLFRLLGTENVGIALTDACLMVPRASISGILFSSRGAFCSCTHCAKHQCPNRRASADATKAKD